ncbi:hypothetical protein GobsT_18380 [Gemmata obscuriglobus]|uniref:Uncharacterized protein n=1 Tax=Gemmata obscuriglobus TaxID=114 RepID=A0A2Z3H9W2_9BACT|nr:hypothetical protein [Gemmata obscuriglobus]AWM39795.1 hypothetical protein C1280_24175 [Gemmata obscuriglobus]QEG27085.1 hypothetical protein GobsT_18380 [Gemmata obscuriglobus]VTS03550.1 unnamed protein product [Gemmata obscuriglobus UQM 2246]
MSDDTRLNKLQAQTSFTAEELIELGELEDAKLKTLVDSGTQHWGNWVYNPAEPPSIDYKPQQYEIVLTRIDSTAKLGDWLLHLNEKNWITAEDLGNLVKGVEALASIGYHSIHGRGVA